MKPSPADIRKHYPPSYYGRIRRKYVYAPCEMQVTIARAELDYLLESFNLKSPRTPTIR